MRRNFAPALVVIAALVWAGPAARSLRAQDGTESPRAEALRQAIENRFAARVQEELGLSADQASKLRSTTADFARRRRQLAQQERLLRGALAGQLRPGIAADQDSVARLTDAIVNARVGYAETYRDELRAMSTFLTPVQRAEFLALRERLLQRIQRVQAGQAGADDSLGLDTGRPARRPLRRRP